MATPNPHGNKHPSYAQHAVSTPINHLQTPSISTPRSIPSPAIHRSGASRPPNATKMTPGGAAMSTSLSQMSNNSNINTMGPIVGLGVMGAGMLGIGASPSTSLLAFNSPAALAGLDMITPSALMDTGIPGTHAMNLSLSDLGIHSGKRNEDEERRLKIESVLGKLLGKRKRHRGDRFGRLSEEGVRRVGRWAGLDVEVESKWESKEFEGRRPVQMAGKNTLLDFVFNDNRPTKIEVSLSNEETAATPHQAAAASILLEDLTPLPGIAAINTKLDRFAANLEALARLDKLSVDNQLNCHEAIAGVYTSLQKLYQHEKEAASTLLEAKGERSDVMVEREVICKYSGRPRMHTRRKIGMFVDYWMEKRYITPDTSKPVSEYEEAMDVDTASKSRDSQYDQVLYSIEITAQSSSPELYPSIRVSTDWISDRILVPSSETTSPSALFTGGPSIDWQDPSPTYLSANDQNEDAMNIVGSQRSEQQKLPSARFVAKLDPPLVMPWNIANQILQTVGDAASADMDPLRTYETVLLEHSNISSTGMMGTGPAVTNTKIVTTPEGDKEHRNALFVPKQDFVYELKEIPFAHPRQIVSILPTLRQWACFGSLVRNTFVSSQPKLSSQTSQIPNRDGLAGKTERKQFSLAELLTPPESPDDMIIDEKGAGIVLSIDVSLATTPSPGLDIIFPLPNKQTDLASLNVSVLADADIVVTGQNLVGEQVGKSDNAGEELVRRVRDMGRALEITGDLGLWIEWLRRRYES